MRVPAGVNSTTPANSRQRPRTFAPGHSDPEIGAILRLAVMQGQLLEAATPQIPLHLQFECRLALPRPVAATRPDLTQRLWQSNRRAVMDVDFTESIQHCLGVRTRVTTIWVIRSSTR